MKTLSIERIGKLVEETLRNAQDEKILITKSGKPYAVVTGLENLDAEDLAYCGSEEFWAMIEASRKSPTTSLDKVEAELFGARNVKARSRPMNKSTRNTGKPWTPADNSALRQMAKQNTPTRVIGLKLGRTPAAVNNEASKIGVSLKPTNQAPYNRRGK